MRRLGAVKQKIPCVFLTKVIEEPSAKRDQPFQILASETLNPKALEADLHNAIPTEKVDGTCCYVTTWKGQQYLWARLDRKPNKQAEKRFRKFQHSGKDPKGWVPVEKNNKQYCWHSAVVNYEVGVALLLRPHSDGGLEITMVPLTELQEQTLELIGTNINANPYGLGSKSHPVHFLVSHGAFPIHNPPIIKYLDLAAWFKECKEGKVEGIVWHCSDGTLLKLHRHHLGLPWPVPNIYLNSQPVLINVDLTHYSSEFEPNSLFTAFAKLNGQRFNHLQEIPFTIL
ncbi:RNA ligase 1 isoform X3 [Latimeria chalumnae]|uniref:RNA ligase 1 isoform X3 n=1 Tax=Latimeria chalumnae TaxID=7897 RepID=UPI0003C10523|nr:PREDICTED: uncharacterized protein C12orf29 homolog isoform X4 [Latimeria chalumnae]|eukprot:XP_006011067.1 PREDICTED: uncharacterized protein C12orf29 homolog isoform X4 [Latimeria chalumnae]